MSELKAGVIRTPHDEGMSFDRDSDPVAVTEGETEFYLKSEVDKVIRRQKYKRCLTNARYCLVKAWYYNEARYRWGAHRMWKWRQRWLDIAKLFNPIKPEGV